MFLMLQEIGNWLCVFLVGIFVRPEWCTGIAFHNMQIAFSYKKEECSHYK